MSPSTRSCWEPWPDWSSRWFGWLARNVIFLVAGVVGLGLLLLADFGANGFSNSSVWDAEATTVLFLGLATLVTGFALAIRPSRATAGSAAVIAAAIPVAGAIM